MDTNGKTWKEWYSQDYLTSEHWQETRKAVLRRANWKCEECGSCEALQVHHSKEAYKHLWHEPLHMLTCLCSDCHWAEHSGKQKIRTWGDIRAWLDRN